MSFKDIHTQGTDLEAFVGGACLSWEGDKYIMSTTYTPWCSSHLKLPAAPHSMQSLQEPFLALATASGTPLEQDLAVLAYLDTMEVGLNIIVQQEEAAAVTHARFASIINKAEQRKVSSQHIRQHACNPLVLHACNSVVCPWHSRGLSLANPSTTVVRCFSCRVPATLLAAARLPK
jgi:hypothetical protein